ncbi:MAG TPA: hypothetical protein PKD04_05475 [Rhodocyclaceae bacterium]|nr:hypothetical protein [Betaproteobacteria bacterium]HMV00512.1 hypothetical protein [Rhodocyclaceae bacterium]HMV20351.1 hypothetical protein [Rhodocyclaceae bacterium]HMW77694.1 hypothetical protein [Rhodocyclaceae bacterium]HNE44382.1 hypothetical protein [Rhodocyclaceae bacterium]
MGRLSNESFEAFLQSLKQAGIVITNEEELRERLAEAQRWRYAFTTLASNGRQIGISFEETCAGCDEAEIRRAFDAFEFPARAQAAFAASLKTHH